MCGGLIASCTLIQINRKCGWACVNYHLSALKPLRSFGPTQRGPTMENATALGERSSANASST